VIIAVDVGNPELLAQIEAAGAEGSLVLLLPGGTVPVRLAEDADVMTQAAELLPRYLGHQGELSSTQAYGQYWLRTAADIAFRQAHGLRQ
jgi:hypothetical protein